MPKTLIAQSPRIPSTLTSLGQSRLKTLPRTVITPLFGSGAPDQYSGLQKQPKILWIINPKAGGVSGMSVQNYILEQIKAQSSMSEKEVTFFEASDAASLQQEIEKYKGSLDRVVAVGGDGTVSNVISAVMKYPELKIGVLPMGTGNRLAHNMGIPLKIPAAIKTILKGNTRPMDVGTANGHCFTLMAGAGVDAAIMKNANQDSKAKRMFGMFAYFLPTLRQIMTLPIQEFTVEADGKTIKRKGIGVLVANVGKLFGNLTLTPGAKSDDGKFDVAILSVKRTWDYVKCVYQILAGKVGTLKDEIGVIHFEAKNIKITTSKPAEAQVDGDFIGNTPLEINFVQQIPLLTPAK